MLEFLPFKKPTATTTKKKPRFIFPLQLFWYFGSATVFLCNNKQVLPRPSMGNTPWISPRKAVSLWDSSPTGLAVCSRGERCLGQVELPSRSSIPWDHTCPYKMPPHHVWHCPLADHSWLSKPTEKQPFLAEMVFRVFSKLDWELNGGVSTRSGKQQEPTAAGWRREQTSAALMWISYRTTVLDLTADGELTLAGEQLKCLNIMLSPSFAVRYKKKNSPELCNKCHLEPALLGGLQW